MTQTRYNSREVYLNYLATIKHALIRFIDEVKKVAESSDYEQLYFENVVSSFQSIIDDLFSSSNEENRINHIDTLIANILNLRKKFKMAIEDLPVAQQMRATWLALDEVFWLTPVWLKKSAPRVNQRIWFGSVLPPKYQQFLKNFKEHNLAYRVIIWTDFKGLTEKKIKEFKEFCAENNFILRNIRDYTYLENYSLIESELDEGNVDDRENAAVHFARASDLARISILYEMGGIYSDTDTNCIGPIPEYDLEFGVIIKKQAKEDLIKNGQINFQAAAYDFIGALPKNLILKLSNKISENDYYLFGKGYHAAWKESKLYHFQLQATHTLTGTPLVLALAYFIASNPHEREAFLRAFFADSDEYMPSGYDQSWLAHLKKINLKEMSESRINAEKTSLDKFINDIESWRIFKLTQLNKDEFSLKALRENVNSSCDVIRDLKEVSSSTHQQSIESNNDLIAQRIATLNEISGPIEAFFDECGKEFQRPNRNPHFIKRPALTHELSRHFKQKDQTMLVLAGLRGMGKTTVAADYYLNPHQSYNLRAWFKVGNSSESLESQYINLALENGVTLPDSWSQEQKALFVKEWLEQQENCLLVYDDMIEPKLLEPFLPSVKSHQIIITTPNQVDWLQDKRFCFLEVPAMEEQEAIALVYKMTGFSTASEEAIKQLVKTVQCIPLALAQASAYMAVKQCNVSSYLGKYRKHQSYLLTNMSARSPKHAPIWLTFDSEFEATKQACPEAWLLLKQVSWLASEPIPEEVLKSMLDCSDSRWLAVKEQIMRYSFMQINRDGWRMTTLLQDILRNRQGKEESKAILETLCTLFKNRCASNPSEGPLTSHLKQLEQHALNLFPQQTISIPRLTPNLIMPPQKPLFNLTLFSQRKPSPAKAPEEELFELCWDAEDMNRIKQLLAIPGININKPFFLDSTCLIRAARKGHKELVHLLLQHGADKSIADFDGETAADAASSPEIKELINAWDYSRELPDISSLNL